VSAAKNGPIPVWKEREDAMRVVPRLAVARVFSCAFLSIVCASGCESWFQHGGKGVGTLPQTPVSEANFSKTEPAKPFSKFADGLATRTLFQASDGAGTQVEVRDLLIGPGQKTESTSLPGAAVLEIRSGGGTIQIGEKQQELTSGATLSVPEKAAFTIENKSDVPMTIRVFLFKVE
jgi:mannose-6-phosphate isomerase-like protein (cupin superfamily)